MFQCPHCGRSVEAPTPKKVPWWKYDSGGPVVGLGCSTFIIIAIIISVFSQSLRRDIQTVIQKIENVETSIEKLSTPQDAPDEKNE